MRVATTLVAVMGLAAVGCGGVQNTVDNVIPTQEKVYESSRSIPPLEIPPDLSSSTIDNTTKIPEVKPSSATLSDYNNTAARPVDTAVSGVLPSAPDVRVARDGNARWLIVKATPEQMWPQARNFLVETGLLIEREDPATGIIDTDWAEARTRAPQGFVRSQLNRLYNAFYGPSRRDKFRLRLERGAEPDTTEVYISHRGLEEISRENNAPEDQKTGIDDSYVWQPTPPDPELEAEMLNRMVVYLGVSREKAEQLTASASQPEPRARLVQEGGGTTLTLKDDFSRAWRRTGLALDRVGFTVEDRDRSKGLYFVRYVDVIPEEQREQEKGFFSKIFGGDDDAKNAEKDEFRIYLAENDTSTLVTVLDDGGDRENGETADRILGLLHDQLK